MSEFDPKDPAGATEHLNPDGTRKRRKIDRTKQREGYENEEDKRANEIIPKGPPLPGDNLKIKIRPVIGIDNN